MPTPKFQGVGSHLVLVVGILGILIGVIVGFLAGFAPIYFVLGFVAIVILVCFFTNFEQTVLGLLIVRSSLDVFSEQQVPAAIAIVIDVLTLAYVAILILSKRKVQVDGFWYFLAGWIAIQSLWVILLPLGGLGLDASVLPDSIREWVRMFSWLMVYLLIMQLKERVPPEKVISALFLSLVIPLLAALLQVLFPPSILPSFLVFESGYSIQAGSRINGTLGHPNTFATFVLLFLVLTLWKINRADQRLPWLILMGILAFFLVSSNSLTGLMMLVVFIMVFLAFRLNLLNLIGGILLFTVVISLFVSSELGQERLQSLYGTPLLNPNIDFSRAILLQWTDGNSFNWRIAQWTFLLQSWQKYPVWGYGLATASHLSIFDTLAHNDYIRFLVEEGVVGFSLFLTFLGAQLVRLIQLLRFAPPESSQRDLCLIMIAFFMAMLVGMLTGNILTHTTLFFYWWTLMAIAGWDWIPSSSGEINSHAST